MFEKCNEKFKIKISDPLQETNKAYIESALICKENKRYNFFVIIINVEKKKVSLEGSFAVSWLFSQLAKVYSAKFF